RRAMPTQRLRAPGTSGKMWSPRARAVNTIGQSKRGGGDRSSRPAQVQARENEQKALAIWLKGATYEQVAAAGFGITTASGAWRCARFGIPKREGDEAREAQLPRLQAL